MSVFDAKDRRFGGDYEDFRVGDTYKHWPGKTILEADNHLFCLMTMAVHPLHIDSNFSANADGVFSRTVVVGSYVYSLLLGMSVPDMSGRAIANLGTTDLRHLAPVYPGDTLYGESEVLTVRMSRTRPDAGVLTFETRGINQDGVVVARFTRSVLLKRRDSDG
ncbi:MAG: MaoC family dehydratase [Actinomycetota bacterium]|nr:MaoC family dehydratase [Actinomycetota bacterium]